jgi:hypothetical protein
MHVDAILVSGVHYFITKVKYIQPYSDIIIISVAS